MGYQYPLVKEAVMAKSDIIEIHTFFFKALYVRKQFYNNI